MSSLVILLLVVVAIIPPQYVSSSISAQEIDTNKLLDLLQQQRISRVVSSVSSESDDSSDSDSSSEDYVRSGRVGGDNIIDIISKVVNKNNKQGNYNRKNRKERSSYERVQKYSNRNSKYENNQRNNNVAEILEQLFNKGLKEVEPQWRSTNKIPKKRLIPNRLVGDVASKTADDGLENYSKIYILLNPQAIQKSKDSNSAVNKMISKILSLSSPPIKGNQLKPMQKRYKGFAVKGNIGRRRGSRENIEEHRKSNSVYAPKSSGEEKPKRSRNGGGGGGHTAIPYIRHRGENIYERDN